MATYKGNVGHLMQHWTLCEVLTAAQKHTSGLNFIDAHAMAPWATICPDGHDRAFQGAWNALPGSCSVYELAWQRLAPHPSNGYPNSAAFVRQVWGENLEKEYSLLLCENDPATINAINKWLPDTRQQPNCACAKLFPDDWKDRFGRGLPGPADVGLPDDSITMVTFDPYLYSLGPQKPGNLYPEDLERVLCALSSIDGGILIQLSSYSTARVKNAQEAVIDSIDSILLKTDEFQRVAAVKVNRQMMSLVYVRGLKWSEDLEELSGRFEEWMRPIYRRRRP